LVNIHTEKNVVFGYWQKKKGKVVKKCNWVTKVFASKKKPMCREKQVGKFRSRKQCCVPDKNGKKTCHFKGSILRTVKNTKQAACTWIKFKSSLRKKFCCAWWYQCVGRRCQPVSRKCKFIHHMVKRWNYNEKSYYCKLSGFGPHVQTFDNLHYDVPPRSTGSWIVLKNDKKINLVVRTRPFNHVSVITAFSLEYKNTKLEIYGKDNKIKVGGYDKDIKVGTTEKLVDGFSLKRNNLREVRLTLDNGIKIHARWYKMKETRVSGPTVMNLYIYSPKTESAKLFGLCSRQFRKPTTSPFSLEIKKGNYLDTVFAKQKKPFSKNLKIAAKVACLRRGFTKSDEFSNCVTDILNTQKLSTFGILKSARRTEKTFNRKTS